MQEKKPQTIHSSKISIQVKDKSFIINNKDRNSFDAFKNNIINGLNKEKIPIKDFVIYLLGEGGERIEISNETLYKSYRNNKTFYLDEPNPLNELMNDFNLCLDKNKRKLIGSIKELLNNSVNNMCNEINNIFSNYNIETVINFSFDDSKINEFYNVISGNLMNTFQKDDIEKKIKNTKKDFIDSKELTSDKSIKNNQEEIIPMCSFNLQSIDATGEISDSDNIKFTVDLEIKNESKTSLPKNSIIELYYNNKIEYEKDIDLSSIPPSETFKFPITFSFPLKVKNKDSICFDAKLKSYKCKNNLKINVKIDNNNTLFSAQSTSSIIPNNSKETGSLIGSSGYFKSNMPMDEIHTSSISKDNNYIKVDDDENEQKKDKEKDNDSENDYDSFFSVPGTE